jgi:competence protein ComEA
MSMRRHVIVVALVLSSSIGAQLMQAHTTATVQIAATASPSPEDVAARATFEQVCGMCHEATLVGRSLRTPMEWEEVIGEMVALGATGTDEQFAQVTTYLLRNLSKVNVNTARASKLALILDVPAAIAELVVKYRGSNGRFSTIDDLKKIPGLDAEKLESRSARLMF